MEYVRGTLGPATAFTDGRAPTEPSVIISAPVLAGSICTPDSHQHLATVICIHVPHAYSSTQKDMSRDPPKGRSLTGAGRRGALGTQSRRKIALHCAVSTHHILDHMHVLYNCKTTNLVPQEPFHAFTVQADLQNMSCKAAPYIREGRSARHGENLAGGIHRCIAVHGCGTAETCRGDRAPCRESRDPVHL